jgi:hypothetical protein
VSPRSEGIQSGRLALWLNVGKASSSALTITADVSFNRTQGTNRLPRPEHQCAGCIWRPGSVTRIEPPRMAERQGREDDWLSGAGAGACIPERKVLLAIDEDVNVVGETFRAYR